jgi:hypothetical protein
VQQSYFEPVPARPVDETPNDELAARVVSGASADITGGGVRKWIEFMAAMIASKLLLVIILMIGMSVIEGAGMSAQPGPGRQLTQLSTGSLSCWLGWPPGLRSRCSTSLSTCCTPRTSAQRRPQWCAEGPGRTPEVQVDASTTRLRLRGCGAWSERRRHHHRATMPRHTMNAPPVTTVPVRCPGTV